MANPTTNFGWVMPNSADLVTDLPADFAVFGQGVDTSMQYLLGGTTGQVLSKTSATNMAFTWINNDQGDITAVTAGTGISGGGTSGAVTVTNDMATTMTTKGDLVPATGSGTYARLAVGTNGQTLVADSTASTGLAYKDVGVANGLTTTGDTIYSSSGTTQARLGIGSTGQVLTVASGVPSWATPSAGGGLTLIATTNLSGTSVTVSSIPSTYKHLMIVFQKVWYNSNDYPIQFRFNSDTTSNYTSAGVRAYNGVVDALQAKAVNFEALVKTRNAADDNLNMFATFNIYNYTATTGKGFDFSSSWADSGGVRGYAAYHGNYYSTSAISSMTAIAGGQSFSGGTMLTYGVS